MVSGVFMVGWGGLGWVADDSADLGERDCNGGAKQRGLVVVAEGEPNDASGAETNKLTEDVFPVHDESGVQAA